MLKNLITKHEMERAFSIALHETQNAHNKTAYRFALKLLQNVGDDFKTNIRANANETAYNIGDLGETIFKYHLTNDSQVLRANAHETDLNRVRMNEIKTFANSNRYPNGLTEIEGFYSVSKYGVHYITKEIVSKYWHTLKDVNGQKRLTLKWLKDVIANDSPRLHERLTKLMLG